MQRNKWALLSGNRGEGGCGVKKERRKWEDSLLYAWMIGIHPRSGGGLKYDAVHQCLFGGLPFYIISEMHKRKNHGKVLLRIQILSYR
jgi:hypothetical protein